MSLSPPPAPTAGAGTPTGRPSIWTDSHQRKLARLYVYTTLPLRKIIDVLQVVSADSGPGMGSPAAESARASSASNRKPSKDSANKKLNAMLDKEPRWLHPRSRSDMDRRLHELAESKVRNRRAAARGHKLSVSSHASGLAQPLPKLDTQSPIVKQELLSPALDVPEFGSPVSRARSQRSSVSASSHLDPSVFAFNYQEDAMGDAFLGASLTRQLTTDSMDSDTSTGSMHRALSQYSDGFVRAVKKVLRRYSFTVDDLPPASSPASDQNESKDSALGSWVFEDARREIAPAPSLLAGDFLNIDNLLQMQGFCIEGLPEHEMRKCMCHARDEILTSPWVTAGGIEPLGHHLLQFGVKALHDPKVTDGFGNTALHFLAARDAPFHLIFQSLDSGISLGQTNSAGQTFLHLLGPSWFASLNISGGALFQLLQALSCFQFNFGARDVYGRTFFHALCCRVPDASIIDAVLQSYDPAVYARRDAMGMVPTMQTCPPPSYVQQAVDFGSDLVLDPFIVEGEQVEPGISKQAKLIEAVRLSASNPTFEDQHGRNGLHCLAAAILSHETLASRVSPADNESKSVSRKRRRDGSPTATEATADSSAERLMLRSKVMINLIESGVSVNHYDHHGNTVLMAFVAQLPEDDDYKIPPEILRQLIESGADVEARNRAGETALHVAVRRGKKLAMRTLVGAGANASARNGRGQSVLDVADAKILAARSKGDAKMYAHYEACRAWLSGQARAVQNPTVLHEWNVARGQLVLNG